MPARILVAEDDPRMLALIVETLRDDHHIVDEARDGGRLFVELARNQRDGRIVDLIVSDIRMPTCTGLQILEMLRATNRDLPVVLMTAFSDDETRARAEGLGAVLLDKPFALAELRTVVAQLLSGAVHESRPKRTSMR